ncbi:hypothetical protein Vadar_000608 [Vaccinium darrowii]|uniref:Uncharacterized protein n=1 Tax=Vaccinium darrowii TaxID=229202 RepID=A0ACB7WWT7_9ERIC|nr:hypothetical protein Vadar_000608 [Vaccinium darrowii]
MSPSLKIVIFLLLLTYYTCSLASSVDNTSESFFKLCPPTRCSNSGPIIRYPFRLNTQPTFCGREGYELSCSADNTVFPLLFSGHYYVKEIYYPNNWISLTEIPKKNSTNCPIQTLSSFNSSGPILEEPDSNLAIANCSERIVEMEGIYGPIDCLTDGGGNGSWVYVMDTSYRMDRLPLQCSISDHVKFARVILGVQEIVERLLREGEIIVNYRVDYGCLECERAGRYCGFNTTSNKTICSSPKPKTKLIDQTEILSLVLDYSLLIQRNELDS